MTIGSEDAYLVPHANHEGIHQSLQIVHQIQPSTKGIIYDLQKVSRKEKDQWPEFTIKGANIFKQIKRLKSIKIAQNNPLKDNNFPWH